MSNNKGTAIEQAIEKLGRINGWYEDDGPHWISYHDVEEMLQSLLPAEKKILKYGYNIGYTHGIRNMEPDSDQFYNSLKSTTNDNDKK